MDKSSDRSSHDEYAEAGLQRKLTEGEGLGEQGIEVIRRDGIVVVQGEVESEQRRQTILRRVRESFPDKNVRSEIVLIPVVRPGEPEDVS
jgi:BON domain